MRGGIENAQISAVDSEESLEASIDISDKGSFSSDAASESHQEVVITGTLISSNQETKGVRSHSEMEYECYSLRRGVS